MNSRRNAFLLAGALTATVFTGAAAIAGISHRPATAARPAPTPIVHVVQQQSPRPQWEDD